MKKYLSVCMLSARGALWPTVIVSLLGAAATLLCLSGNAAGGLETTFYDAAMAPMYVGIALLCVLLMRILRERGGVQPVYTMQRLRVSETAAFLCQTLVNALALFIFQMCQAAVFLGYGLYMQNAGLGAAENMSLLVSFVTNTFAHALLPLGDVPVYFRMAVVYVTLGAATAYSSYLGRRGKIAISPFVVLALALFGGGFQAYVGEYGTEFAIALTGVFITGIYIGTVRSREKRKDDAEEDYNPGGGDVAPEN